MLACMLCTLTSATPQQQAGLPATLQQPAPTFRVESGLVVVDVTARDKEDHPVDDLKKEDFIDGVIDIVTAADFMDLTEGSQIIFI